MARMIPPIVDKDAAPGERLIFQRLLDDPDCRDWIVLHSLHVADVRRALEGEIDFVIIIPRLGVLCLEVKSHRTVDRGPDGLWHLGKDAPTQKSPFAQAARGAHAVKDYLGRKRLDLQQVPIWSAVWFTGASANLADTPEWHSWQLLDRHDLRRPVSQTLRAVMHKARAHFARTFAWFDIDRQDPDAALCEALASQLRPRFELSLTTKEVARERAAERLSFIEEQFEALDLMEQESRVLFTGPAGTGKSLLAAEAARRAAARGATVLSLCFNRLLGSRLSRSFDDLPNVWAGTLHSYLLEQSGASVPQSPGRSWWGTTLPELALESILDHPGDFDTLIVDEVQDLAANAAYLDVLDASLVGGLSGGRWLMFGDFERQAVYGGGDDGRAALSDRCPHFSRPTLLHNCRNTPQIGEAASRLAGLPDGTYKGYRRRDDGVAPVFRAYTGPSQQEQLLLGALDALRAEHYSNEEIVVLSTKAADSIAALAARGRGANRLAPFELRGTKIGFTSIHAFKGLDAPAVVVTDVDDVEGPAAEALLYVALSRASDRLFILAEAQAMGQLARSVIGTV